MKTAIHLRNWGGRIARSALGAAVFGACTAYIDASWARTADGQGVSSLQSLLADVGLLAPFFFLLGVVAGLVGIFFDPTHPPSPKGWVAALRIRAIGRPADVAAFVPLSVLSSFLWMTLSAHLARAMLRLEVTPALAGIAMAMGSLALGMLCALAALSLTPPLRHALATASDGRPACVDPAITGLIALLGCLLLFSVGLSTGGLSGEGGLFGIYGVFKRPELDLRAPIFTLLAALVALFAPASIARIRGPLAFCLALLPLCATPYASAILGRSPVAAQAIERGAPIGRFALRAVRSVGDRDADGASAWFGGGDCKEGDATIGPRGVEIPDNGVDEDCSGSDLTAAALQETPSPQPPVTATPKRIPPDLNLVLITIDTLRADLGYAGYSRPVSPHIDALAARSTIFERAYSLASYTGKSIGPMLIGKYGTETHRNWGHFNKFGKEDSFLAERLQRAGIHTMSVQGHRYFGNFGGLDRGFDVVDLSAAPPEGAKWDIENQSTSPVLTDAAIALLGSAEHTDKRFFLWVHYLDPHADYLKHEGHSFGTSQRDLYDGEIAFTDEHVGRLLDRIAQSPFGSRTAIVITSDHGEAFGEHKMYRHGFELWEELVRVPLVVHVPGGGPSKVSARRSAIDLVPTALELMGVARPDGSDANDFVSGVSLVSDIFLEPGRPAEARDIMVDMPAGPYNDARRAFIHDDKKLTISNDTRYELYDLAADPDERNNLWGRTDTKALEERYAVAKARMHTIQVTGPRK